MHAICLPTARVMRSGEFTPLIRRPKAPGGPDMTNYRSQSLPRGLWREQMRRRPRTRLSSQRAHDGFRQASNNALQSVAGTSGHPRVEVPADNNWPAVLTRPEAAEMCRISMQTFDAWVRKGILPGPIPGTRRWSRIAIERALAGDVVASTADIWPSPFEQWKRRNAH